MAVAADFPAGSLTWYMTYVFMYLWSGASLTAVIGYLSSISWRAASAATPSEPSPFQTAIGVCVAGGAATTTAGAVSAVVAVLRCESVV